MRDLPIKRHITVEPMERVEPHVAVNRAICSAAIALVQFLAIIFVCLVVYGWGAALILITGV